MFKLIFTIFTTVITFFALNGAEKVVKASSFGFDPKDATNCVQKALDSGAKTIIIDNVGKEYLVRPLTLRSNCEVIFASGVRMRALPGDYKKLGDCLLRAREVNNVTIRGEKDVVLSMNKKDYQDLSRYRHSEWRHLLSIVSCKNIKVSNLKLMASGGDGIYIGTVGSKTPASFNVLLENIECIDHHRQGISVISAKDLTIRNCKFNSTSGTPPICGIDLEPNGKSYELLENILIENCEFAYNSGSGVLFHIGAQTPLNATLRNCNIFKNKNSGISVYLGPNRTTPGVINFEKCVVKNNNGSCLYISNHTKINKLTFKDCILDNRGYEESAIIFNNGLLKNNLDGVNFVNTQLICTPGKEMEIYKKTGFGIDNISGTIKLSDAQGKVNGKVFNMSNFIKLNQPNKKLQSFSTSLFDGKEVKALSPNAQKIQRNWLRTRGRNNTFIQVVPKAGNYQITFEVGKVNRNSINVPVIVRDKMNTVTDKFTITDKKYVYTLKANGENVYNFTYNTRGDAVVVVSSYPGCGFLADNLSLFHANRQMLYFGVPAGVKDINVEVQGSPGEFVWAELRNPQNKSVCKVDKTISGRLHFKRGDNAPFEVWSVYISKSIEDMNISLGEPLIPVLSTVKAQVIVKK